MSDYAIFTAPRMTEAAFVDALRARSSPATPEGPSIYAAIIGVAMDPCVALAFFEHESAMGTQGRAVANKSWGNLRWHDGYAAVFPGVDHNDGFVRYPTWAQGAQHFAWHLAGLDGTDNYRFVHRVSEVVPIYAPLADGNTPDAYIAAVNAFVDAHRQGGSPMPAVLLVAGHNNIEAITNDGACAGRDFTSLRASTGAHGEREWTGSFVQQLADALRATGLVDPTVTDAIYHPDVYAKHFDLCLINHYHRDADTERAMFAGPDAGMAQQWISADAEAQANRFVDRLVGGYTARTGIPVTEPLVTLNMTQIYTYCYVERETPPVCCEWGNANLDAAVLYEPGIARIVTFARDCILEHLNLAPVAVAPPARRASDTPVPPPPSPTAPLSPVHDAAIKLRAIADGLDRLA